MIDLPTLRTLTDYHYWATHRLLAACAALSEEQFTRPLVSSFPSIQATMAHTLGAEIVWLARWQLQEPAPVPPPPLSEFLTLAAQQARWLVQEQAVRAFLDREPDPGRRITYYNREGDRFTRPLWQMVQHVVNHASSHRGQVITLLRQVGATPVGADLIAYYNEVDPQG